MATPKILLVDDTKLFLKLEQEYLKNSSVVILTAENGRQALEVIRNKRPDLVYMDLNMPEMDGVTCCKTIKGDPQLRSIPVILVTTEGHNDSIDRCKSAGCDGFLTKPINRREFLELGRSFVPEINRRERRLPCRVKVMFNCGNGARYGTCLDLCSRGMYIACPGGVEVDEKIEVSMLVAATSDSLVEAWGRVAWVNFNSCKKKRQLPDGFGVEFLSITDESKRLVREFLNHGTATEIPPFAMVDAVHGQGR